MKKVIVTDVFGKTTELKMRGMAIDADIIVDPYDGQNMNFESEIQAYSYFIENVGLDKYLTNLLTTIENYSCECQLIGFSVGASIIWKLSGSASESISKLVKRADCYYGSQIRHLTELSPIFKTTLIFPKKEPHFDVLTLQRTLADKEHVSTMQVDYFHGFMNTHSSNFNRIGYNAHIDLLREKIKH